MQLTGLQGIQVFVGFQLTFCYLQHFHGYIGAMVCGALTGGQQIIQHKTVLHGVKTITQTAHMAGLDLANQSVNDLLLGFDFDCQFPVKAAVSGNGAVYDV